MSYSKAEYMLKYQKAKVKLLEYEIPRDNYPRFPLNYRDLAFPTILILSRYADAIINEDIEAQQKAYSGLTFCSEYYDAALKSREQQIHDLDFILTGAIAYFFQNNYGSAMVLLREAKMITISEDVKGILVNIFSLIFSGKKRLSFSSPVVDCFEDYIKSGDPGNVYKEALHLCQQAYMTNEIDAFFADTIHAIIKIAISNSARKLLPDYSNLTSEKWIDYFNKPNSIKMVWPAQKLIGESGILQGKNAIIQLPTGVGKTKSIELIARSMFMSERGRTVLIIAPLRALCNEITDDMRRSFSSEVMINQFSDILEIDFEDLLSDRQEKRILVCTPEKLQFIIHHEPGVISDIDLFVFDEGHMFDDMSRGAMFELLISNIKRSLTSKQQLIILSAVLSNADIIKDWIFGENGVLAYDHKIRSTPKVVGFVSSEEEVHYFSDSFSEEDFYIPRSLKKENLKTKRAGSKPKVFPENSANDIALYYANLLCNKGGIAIYMGQRRYIPTILKRLVEIADREYDLSRLLSVSDENELNRLQNLIDAYYGKDSVYYKASLLGVFPHYSSLPNGLRMSVEHAFRKNKIKVVVCTSTLAQGVNIPIKYMIMTSLKSAQNLITARSFQNLIGRTARSGVYTEGSILITDPKLYDSRGKGRGYYAWQEATGLFDANNTEACSSAILSIVQDFYIDYELRISGASICKFLCLHISENWREMLITSLTNYLQKKDKQTPLTVNVVKNQVASYQTIIESLENEICYELVCHAKTETGTFDEQMTKVTMQKLNDSLAYYLATDDEKELLTALFNAISNRLKNNQVIIPQMSKAMVGVEITHLILGIIKDKELNTIVYSGNDLLSIVLDLYNTVYPNDSLSVEICNQWINGFTYLQMCDSHDMKIDEVEKKCGQTISYQFSFLVGNVIDYLDAESVNLEGLMTLQKQLKYGVSSTTAISLCEKVFNDRIIANIITEKLKCNTIREDKIQAVIKHNSEKILDIVDDYPSFFGDRIRFLCR